MATIWDALLAYSPEVLWKLNDASGTTAVDASTNARDGTLVNTPTLGEASLIPNVPTDKSMRVTAANLEMIDRAHESWMNADIFTIGFWFKPATVTACDLTGKQERVQLWLEADGSLTFYIFDTDWRPFSTPAGTIVAGNTYYIVFTCSATNRRIIVNGVLKATGSSAFPRDTIAPYQLQVGHSSTSTGRYANGWFQGFHWIPADLTTSQVLALHNIAQTAPSPPPAPGAFTSPTLDALYADGTVAIDCGDSADADSYDFDYSQDSGGSWTPIVAAHPTSDYTWDTSAVADGATIIRAKANNAYGSSSYTESDEFTIAHYDPGLNLLDSGIVFEDLHTAPGLGDRVTDPVTHVTTVDGGPDDYTTDLTPDSEIWTPSGPLTDRWREGHGYDVGLPNGITHSSRIDGRHLWVYGGPLVIDVEWHFNDDGDVVYDSIEFADVIDPPLSDTNMMILQSAFTGDDVFGVFRVRRAAVCLWRDPETGSALVFESTHNATADAATLRFYDGPSNAFAGNIPGLTTFADGSTHSGGIVLPGSYGSAYDDDLIDIGFSIVGGIVTLYTAATRYIANSWKFVADLSAYITTPGGIAYATNNPTMISEHQRVRASVADYIEVTGLREGWIVRAEQRTYENWITYDLSLPNPLAGVPDLVMEAVQFATIEAVADADGIARVYPFPADTSRRVVKGSAEWDTLGDIDYTITAHDMWTFDKVTVLIDEDTVVDEYIDLNNIVIGARFAWGHKDLPAYKPGEFVTPAADDVVGAVNPYTVEWAEHAPPHPDDEDVEYKLEFSPDGGTSWSTINDWTPGNTFAWDHSGVAFTRNAQLRVSGRGTTSLIASALRYSETFIVYHSVGALVAAESDEIVNLASPITQFSAFMQPATSPDGHKSTRWRFRDVLTDTEVLDITADGDERTGKWITGLQEAHRYSYTYALIDYLDVQGAWSDARDFYTLNLTAFDPHVTRDEVGGTDGGSYREYQATAIDSVTGGMPELLGDGGARLNMNGIDFEQTPAAFPNQTHHLIRFESEDAPFQGGTDYRNGFSAMLVCVPQDLASRRELMGQPGSLIVWHDVNGGLHVTVVTTNNPSLAGDPDAEVFESGNTDFDFSHGAESLVEGALQTVFVGGREAWYSSAIAVTGVGSPEVRNWEILLPRAPASEVQFTELFAGVNGEWRRQLVTNSFNGTHKVSDRFKVARPEMFDVGHGSTNADATSDVEASGRSARMIVRTFAFWNTVLSSDVVKILDDFVRNDDLETLWEYMATMDPQPICFSKFQEYPRPDKPTVAMTVVP